MSSGIEDVPEYVVMHRRPAPHIVDAGSPEHLELERVASEKQAAWWEAFREGLLFGAIGMFFAGLLVGMVVDKCGYHVFLLRPKAEAQK